MDFNQAEERFKDLKSKFEAGALSENKFKSQLEELMVQDEGGNWWMIGYETEQWYRYDGKAWVQSDPPGGQLQKPKPKIANSKFETSTLEKKPEAQESLWKFGKKQIIQSAIGLGIAIFLFLLVRQVLFLGIYFPPASAVPLFFGLAFGPIVGAIVGSCRHIFEILFYGVPFSNITLFSYALEGLIMGFVRIRYVGIRNFRDLIRIELFVVLAFLIPNIVFRPWSYLLSNLSRVFFQLIGWLILIPVSMVVYSFILAQIKSRKK